MHIFSFCKINYMLQLLHAREREMLYSCEYDRLLYNVPNCTYDYKIDLKCTRTSSNPRLHVRYND